MAIVNYVNYTVQPGDTLTKIAARYGTTVGAIVRENGIVNPDLIFVGQVLRIPVGPDGEAPPAAPPPPPPPPPPPSGFPTYVVRPGDTLTAIARAFGTVVEAIVAANELVDPDLIEAGQVLRIPVGPDGEAPPGFNLYVVQAGDSTFRLAVRFGTTVAAIAAANGLAHPGVIFIGERLSIPTGPPPVPIFLGNPARPRIALTFDDGGTQARPILDILGSHGIRATFFWSGVWLTAFPEIVEEAAAAGHEVENHGYDHPFMTVLNPAQVRAQILAAASVIVRLTGRHPVFFRPPFGDYNDGLLWAAVGIAYRPVLWTVDTFDWQNPDVEAIVERAVGGARPGAIILMHDFVSETTEALPQIIESLQAPGYELATLEEVVAP